jgi:putative DNA primase/helicase
MAYISFDKQIESHLSFLKEQGLDVAELVTNGKFVRCHSTQEQGKGRGEFVYKSYINPMKNGLVGIQTWVRGINGENRHSTYGLGESSTQGKATSHNSSLEQPIVIPHSLEGERKAEEKARLYFEVYSSKSGHSKYLEEKNIKAYGIRFRESSEYGRTIVIPARNIEGTIKTCQNIGEDGTKRFLNGRSPIGTFHALLPLENRPIIGICEGYATSATCAKALKEIPIAIVCAFDSNNLDAVGQAIHSKYPKAKILFLSDNDRHLVIKGCQNKGLEAPRIASNNIGAMSTCLEPDFANLEPLKRFSDWNDLCREFGMQGVRSQISKFLYGLGWITS